MRGMMLQCGGQVVTLDEVRAVKVPEATNTWFPMGYIPMIEQLEKRAGDLLGAGIKDRQLGLGRNGDQFFGLWELDITDDEGMGISIGARGSVDKSVAQGFVAGGNVFVCDNMMFCGDSVHVVRKNTRHVLDDVMAKIDDVLKAAVGSFDSLVSDRQRLKEIDVDTTRGYELIGRAVGTDVLRPTQANVAYREWKKSEHEEFRPRNLWSLYNAFTEGLKKGQAGDVISRHTGTHTFFSDIVQGYSSPIELTEAALAL